MAKKSGGFGIGFILFFIIAIVFDNIQGIPSGLGTLVFWGFIFYVIVKSIGFTGKKSFAKNVYSFLEEAQKLAIEGNEKYIRENSGYAGVEQVKRNIDVAKGQQQKSKREREQVEFNEIAGKHNLDGKDDDYTSDLQNTDASYSDQSTSRSLNHDDLGTSQTNPFSLDGK